MFTFITCTYNHQEFILMHLESIKYQIIHYFDGVSVSLIISDDGSKDKTLYLCNQWVAANKHLFDSIEILGDGINRGTCKNIINAFRHLKTDLFFLLAGDDVYGYRSIAEVAANLDVYDLVSAPCPAFYQDLNSKFKVEMDYELYKTNISKGLCCSFLRRILTITGCFIEAAPALYKRQLIDDKVIHFISGFQLIEDQPMFYLFLKNNKICFKYLDYSYVFYRINPSSVSHTDNSLIKERTKADVEKLCEHYMSHEKNPVFKYAAFIRKKSLNCNFKLLYFYPTYLYLIIKQNIFSNKVKEYYRKAIKYEERNMIDYLYKIEKNKRDFEKVLINSNEEI